MPPHEIRDCSMNNLRSARSWALIGSAALVAVLSAPPIFSAFARPKEPVIQAPPPPPPPPGPVSLPSHSLADAAAYQAWLERQNNLSPAFVDGPSVARALKDVTATSASALIRDAVAYGAVAALEDQDWVTEVRKAGNSPENRRLMVQYLMADPRYALSFRGSDHAAGLAQQAIGGPALKLFDQGKAVRQASYDIQHQDWSKAEVADRPGRLAMVEQQGKGPLPDAADHVAALQAASTGGAPLPVRSDPLAPPYPPIVAESLQLAAIAALGEAGDDMYDRLAALAGDDRGAEPCLHEAKLNLYQCLAVAKPHYEDVYCMGQHAMSDAAACLVTAVGLSVPLPPVVQAPPAAPPPAKKTVTHKKR
jgi:hypothetical protein